MEAGRGTATVQGPVLGKALRLELEELVAGMCKALNDPKRLLVLYALRDSPRTVGQLSELLEAPQANTSQHLAVLRDRGLLESERRGTSVVYSLRHPKVLDAIEILRDVMVDEVDRLQALRQDGDLHS
ncbi:MAG: metalloregulator ArsR/SmtB family transcription factor [Actinomycetota bacterium]|jgi:ArsR family transcriptional regulator|nr:metalloregulator ArsR/SmtB family transcription factor [Actinomycetota bacterium]